MRTPLLCFLALLPACGTLARSEPFEHQRDRLFVSTKRSPQDQRAAPRGVSWRARLRGVEQTPREGQPSKFYELRIDLQQAADVGDWVAELRFAELHDDEDNKFSPSEVLFHGSEPKSGNKKNPREAEMMRQAYKAQFVVPPGHRFFQIQRIKALWTLAGPKGERLYVQSEFQH